METVTAFHEELAAQATAQVAAITQGLRPLLELVRRSIVVTDSNGSASLSNNLSTDDLQSLAMRIPAECAYIQTRVNDMLISHSLQVLLTEGEVTQNIQLLHGAKGDAKERLRRAEAMSQKELLRDAARQQTIRALQDYIERADKVYEGVKKIIDAKSREFNFDGKPGRPL